MLGYSLARGFLIGVVGATTILPPATSVAANEGREQGRELFVREWLPGDSRSHSGDGLGPMFNETSCVACHNQGGTGGGGSAAKNVQIVSVFSNRPVPSVPSGPALAVVWILLGSRSSKPADTPKQADAKPAVTREEQICADHQFLERVHPGFKGSISIVLHRFSTDPGYSIFRTRIAGTSSFSALAEQRDEARSKTKNTTRIIGDFTLLVSERNAPALFGSGKIDTIPDEVIEAAAGETLLDFPEVHGRVAKLKDGKIGRFGWKGQKAHLEDFVLAACAVELGLHVPGQEQSGVPNRPDYKALGQDLSEKECKSLTDYVASLRQPDESIPENPKDAAYLAKGQDLFRQVGCAACHRPHLGDVKGIYSDLLLHDMGSDLVDSGSYANFVPNTAESEDSLQPIPTLRSGMFSTSRLDTSKLVGATRSEWQTPPLWGVRDSAPYLHDGRAATLEQAIALHAGEASRSARQFFDLSQDQRLQLTLFLRSLTAPH